MKFALASDVHLEFGDITLHNDQQADVLILSGDICTAKVFKKKPKERALVHQFFSHCSYMFPQVVYVMGNHEHYDFDFRDTYDKLKSELAPLVNVHLLEKECFEYKDITFVGGTLWTDMNKDDALTKWHCGQKMNDFKLVKNSNRMVHRKRNVYDENNRDEFGNMIVKSVDHYQTPSSFSVEDSIEEHKKMVDYIKIATEDKSKKYVVVGHHAPTHQSIAEWYKHDTLLNGAFASDLSEFIMDRPQIKMWTHGHMHDPFDYMVGETRVVCNPRGYIGYEQRANKFELQYYEV